ncbi:MAG TPA: CorA family divalent cation transporter, partial [Flexilinea sp.]|nr:CorA family divalent cation transporter [Flexilinea sp.]
MDAFASVISNNLNVVMKLLASVTIILSIPNVISGFFGMNINFPDVIETHESTMIIIFGIIVLFTFFAIYIFQKKNWF